MKPVISYLKMLLPSKRLLNYSMVAILLISQSSCFKKYYQTNTTYKVEAAALEQLDSSKKLFILHTPDGTFSLKNVKVSGDTLSGYKGLLDPKNNIFLNPAKDTGNRISNKYLKACISEVHLYTDSSFNGMDHVMLAIRQIHRMDVYGKDMQAINNSKIGSFFAIGIGVAVIIGIVADFANFHYTYTFPH